MIESTLHAILAANPGVTAACAGGIQPVVLPETPTLPALTYQVISGEPDATLDGPSGFVERRIQFDSWGSCYSDAKALQEAVRLAISGLSGLQADGTLIFNVMEDTPSDFYEPDSKYYRASTDYKVQYSQ